MKVGLLISQFIQNFPVLNTFGFNCPILSDVHDLTIYQHSCIHEQNITQSDFNNVAFNQNIYLKFHLGIFVNIYIHKKITTRLR